MKQIDIQIAANDKVAVIEEKLFLERVLMFLLLFLVVASWLGLIIQGAAIVFVWIAYYYHKDLKEKERLVRTYGL
jgi:cell division protein FtsL